MEQTDILRYVIEQLNEIGVPYMLVGSISSSVWGDPRMTRDIDIVIRLRQEDVRRILASFPFDDFYIGDEAVQIAIDSCGQFNVIHPKSGNKIDFMIAADDEYGVMQMQRRRYIKILPDLEGYSAAPEDTIIGKMIYYKDGKSEKHLRDIAGMLKISSELIDISYIDEWSEKLGLASIWTEIKRKVV